MGMVVAESSIPVSSLVQEFNKIGKSKFETEKSLIIECEIEIKGIVKKVVKVKFISAVLFYYFVLDEQLKQFQKSIEIR